MKNGRLSANDGFWADGMILGVIAFAIVVALCTSGCAYSHAAAKSGSALEENCGEFKAGVIGIPPFYTPAGQYATYSNACATRRTVEVIAAQREAVVRGAWAAAAKAGAVDPKARKMARAALRMSRTTAAVVTSEGGAR